MIDRLHSFAASIQPAYDRIAYCSNRLGNGERYGSKSGRAFGVAQKLLGWELWAPQRYFPTIDRKGLWGAVNFYREISGRDLLADVKPLDEAHVGWVYNMAVKDDPEVVKIGFSRTPEARQKVLERQYGVSLEIVSLEPGTMLDEMAAHIRWCRVRIWGEWFFIPGSGRTETPDFIRKEQAKRAH